jgi:hypothetical protein
MDEDRDLLPWIFGGLSMASVAIAITMAASKPDAPALAVPETEALPKAVLALPKAVLAPPKAAALPAAGLPTPPAASTFAAAQMQTAAPPMQPSSRVWECTINGQKTFSDAPCGDKSSVREIGPINRMDPSPILSYAPSYGRESSYQPGYSYPGEQPDTNAEQQFAGNPYPVFVGVPVHERARPDHTHRPHGHNRGNGLAGHPGIGRQ